MQMNLINLIKDKMETFNIKVLFSTAFFVILLLCYQGNIPIQNKLAVTVPHTHQNVLACILQNTHFKCSALQSEQVVVMLTSEWISQFVYSRNCIERSARYTVYMTIYISFFPGSKMVLSGGGQTRSSTHTANPVLTINPK